jgi:hypothetical protein
MTTQSRPEQLADAFEAVCRVNHYMVGIVEPFTSNELEAAEQILITRQNASKQGGAHYWRLDMAISLIENARTRQTREYSTD